VSTILYVELAPASSPMRKDGFVHACLFFSNDRCRLNMNFSITRINLVHIPFPYRRC
jgi:hypothetical protein